MCLILLVELFALFWIFPCLSRLGKEKAKYSIWDRRWAVKMAMTKPTWLLSWKTVIFCIIAVKLVKFCFVGELFVRIQFNGSAEAYPVSGVKLDNGYNHLIEVIRNVTLVQVKINGTEYFR